MSAESGDAIDWLELFVLPKTSTVSSRSSSVTNAFVNAIIPRIPPTAEEVRSALDILGMGSGEIECSYCGDGASEWDHLRPVVRNKRPTGYITEIRNLVPSCGKCNQSKGASNWSDWMTGPARRSPRSRGISDVEARMDRLARFEEWGGAEAIKLDDLVPKESLDRHWANLEKIVDLLRSAQEEAKMLRDAVATELERRSDERTVLIDEVPSPSP